MIISLDMKANQYIAEAVELIQLLKKQARQIELL